MAISGVGSTGTPYLEPEPEETQPASTAERADGATISLGSFEEAVDDARRFGIGNAERKTLKDAFGRLREEDKGKALEFVLRHGSSSKTYNLLAADKPKGEISREGFEIGIQDAKDSGFGISASDRKMLKDAFDRLPKAEQGKALEYVLKMGEEKTYRALIQ